MDESDERSAIAACKGVLQDRVSGKITGIAMCGLVSRETYKLPGGILSYRTVEGAREVAKLAIYRVASAALPDGSPDPELVACARAAIKQWELEADTLRV